MALFIEAALLGALLASQTPACGPQIASPRAKTLTIDAPLSRLLLDPDAHAILERDLPNLDKHPRLNEIQALSLRTIVPNSRGWFTEEQLRRVSDDLSELRDQRRHSVR